ncbi:MAG TPA: SMP-30/gluconolactonase/LRE family protein [Clostridia bacterium]|nr:SMP-30/gluconolactonase/LRE family protein [Clostridia bacterium]
MVTEIPAEVVLDARAVLGEGPVWDTRAHVLWWVDIEGQRIHRFDPASEHDVAIETASAPGAVALGADGGLVAAFADGIRLLDGAALDRTPPVPADSWRPLVSFERPQDVRCNDAKCDPAGRLLVGRMAWDERRVGALLAVEPDGSVRRLLDGLSIPNGMAWTADGGTFYFIDTPDRRIDAWDYDVSVGTIERRRTHVAFAGDDPASPDGMTIDVEGGLWVACWGGWAVRRFTPDGTLDAVIRVAAAQVTSCTFGGPDLRDLYITTAARGIAPGDRGAQPAAGGIFRARPGVAGVAPHRFAGEGRVDTSVPRP